MDKLWLSGPRSPSESKSIPAATRTMVLERDGDECRYCGLRGSSALDHINPHAQGGTPDQWNLAVCCTVCNSIAGIRTFDEFFYKRQYVIYRRMELGYPVIQAMYALDRALAQLQDAATGRRELTDPDRRADERITRLKSLIGEI